MYGKAMILGLAMVMIMMVASCGGGSFGFIPEDNTSPELAVFGVTDGGSYGALIAGPDVLNISAVASDDAGIAAMTLHINGALVASSNTANLAYNWDTAAESNGHYELRFQATDANGNKTLEVMTVSVTNMIVLNPGIIIPDLELIFP